MRTLLSLAALMLLAACPESVGQQCPVNTVPAGQFALNFAGQRGAGECISDAGLDAGGGPLTRDNGGTSNAAVCFGNADGGQQVWLVIPGKSTRTSPLLADGGFQFLGHSDPLPGTPCVCPVAIDETFSGSLQASGGAPFVPQEDGGLPLVTGLSGSVVDVFSTDAGADAGCACDLPCSIDYTVTGSRQ